MAELSWLSETQWAAIEPLLPHLSGKFRVDDRRVLSGISHRFREGLRWRAPPDTYGPCTTVFKPLNQWSLRGLRQERFAALFACGYPPRIAMVDSTSVRAHRAAAGGKGGTRNRRSGGRVADGRTDNQDPCNCRSARPDRGHPADAVAGRRHHRCPRPACCDPSTCRSDRRQGLRRRRSQGISHPAMHPPSDLADAEPPRCPVFRRHRLPTAQPDRARALQAQGLPCDRHSLE